MSLWVLSRLFWREWVRQRVFFVFIVATFLLSLLALLLASLSFNERLRITLHLGFSVNQWGLNLLALFLGSSVLHKELEQQTLYMILARPLTRSVFFWSKIIGALQLLGIGTLWTAAVHFVLLGVGYDILPRFVYAYSTSLLEALVLFVVALFFSVLFQPALAFSAALVLGLGGYWSSDLMYFAKKAKQPIFDLMAELSPYLFPRLEIFTELRNYYFIIEGSRDTVGALAYLQIILYGWLFATLGEWMFSRRDLNN